MISNWACQLRHVSVYFTERKIMRLRDPMELNAGIKNIPTDRARKVDGKNVINIRRYTRLGIRDIRDIREFFNPAHLPLIFHTIAT